MVYKFYCTDIETKLKKYLILKKNTDETKK